MEVVVIVVEVLAVAVVAAGGGGRWRPRWLTVATVVVFSLTCEAMIADTTVYKHTARLASDAVWQ